MTGSDISEADAEDPKPPAPPWRVLKFGGTSVSSVESWASIEQIARRRIAAGYRITLVCSAVAGVTDRLTELVSARRHNEPGEPIVNDIVQRHLALGRELGIDAGALIADDVQRLAHHATAQNPGPDIEAEIISHGELLSTRIGAAWLAQRGVSCAWVDARELLRTDTAPTGGAQEFLSATCTPVADPDSQARMVEKGASVIVTQGFVARCPEGRTVLLGRGGSDTSAAYIACILGAERLEIWTDVPGLFTANPRLLPNARMLRRVAYREAQALGALGAKALHPRAIDSVWEHGIPVEIGWTARPETEGTCINASRAGHGVKAITSRHNLAMFAFRRPPSWQPVGFLAEVAAQFARRGLSMDLVSSSCSEIRVTVDLDAFPAAKAEIPGLLETLGATCEPRVVMPVASVSVVGEGVGQALLASGSTFDLFADEALFMVVHAANEHHVSFVLDEYAADHLVRTAHARLIGDGELDQHDLGPTWAQLTADRVDGEAA